MSSFEKLADRFSRFQQNSPSSQTPGKIGPPGGKPLAARWLLIFWDDRAR